VTDRFPDYDDQPPTFRADLPRPRRGLGRRARLLIALAVTLVLALVLAAVFVKTAYLSDLPQTPTANALWSLNRAPGVTFLDRYGAKIATRGPRNGARVRLSELPAYVPRAFLAAEDRRFYLHGPVDVIGSARAAFANARAGQVVQGGSTLTQQLAKSLFLTPDQTLKRKVQEAALAFRLSQMMSRDQILELYLNRVFFGASAYGIEAASEIYFGKPARSLTLPEAALLAALPKAPSRLSPVNDMPAALGRSHMILQQMLQEGWISTDQERAALKSPPQLAPEPSEDDDFGYVLDLAQSQAAKLSGGKAPDLVVQLTIDPMLQTSAAEIVRRVMETDGVRAGARQAALAALAQDGAVRALVGGLDHRFSRFDRAVQAQRQPGSAFKPFVYAAALEAGVKPSDVRSDSPVQLGPWSPSNYGGGYKGKVTVQQALAQSINTVAVRLAQEVGPEKVSELAARFGVDSIPVHPGLSVALGAYETNLLQLTSGYQVFQQQGRRSPAYLISRITTSSGDVLYGGPASPPEQVFDPARDGDMVRMLEGVIEHGTGAHAGFGRPAAGKTGTSQTWRDAWFVGFTPDWVCGVWVGNDDDRPMNKVTGADLPADIWRRFMMVAHQGLPSRDFPWLGGSVGGAPAPVQAGERAAFYQTLSADFADAAKGSDEPTEASETTP
jgi:penicillin-binding protein 1A